LSGTPQAEVTHLGQAAQQHALEEAAHELLADGTNRFVGSRSCGPCYWDAARPVVDTGDAGVVGKSHTEDVAGKVVEHSLIAVAAGGGVNWGNCGCRAQTDPTIERHGATVEDVLDGAPLRWQHRRA
jgi:hypothetical protein